MEIEERESKLVDAGIRRVRMVSLVEYHTVFLKSDADIHYSTWVTALT